MLKSLTGVGVYDSDSDSEIDKGTGAGGRFSLSDTKMTASHALTYAKRKGIITDAIDQGETYLLSKASKPEHGDLIKLVRKTIKSRYGVGVAPKSKTKFVKGSTEAKVRMAKLRAMRKTGGSFRL